MSTVQIKAKVNDWVRVTIPAFRARNGKVQEETTFEGIVDRCKRDSVMVGNHWIHGRALVKTLQIEVLHSPGTTERSIDCDEDGKFSGTIWTSVYGIEKGPDTYHGYIMTEWGEKLPVSTTETRPYFGGPPYNWRLDAPYHPPQEQEGKQSQESLLDELGEMEGEQQS